MNTTELRSKSNDELQTELRSLLKEQLNLRMRRGLGEEPKTHGFKQVRKNIARVKTILKEQASK